MTAERVVLALVGVGGAVVAVADLLDDLLEVGDLVGGQDDPLAGQERDVLELGRERPDPREDVGPAHPHAVVLRLGPAGVGETVGELVERRVVGDPEHLDRAPGRLRERLPPQ